MAGMLGYLAGGLAEGVGEGMQANGKAMREEALREIEARRRMELEDTRQRGATERADIAAERADTRAARSDERSDARAKATADAAMSRLNLQISSDSEKVVKTIPDENGNYYGVTARGKKVDIGVKGAPPAVTAAGQMPADVKSADWYARITAEAEGRTEVTAKDKKAAFDYVKEAKNNPVAFANVVARFYDAKKKDTLDRRPDSVKMSEAQSQAAAAVGKVPDASGFDEARFSRARGMAQAEAEERTGVMSSRSSEFPETKGNMETWINDRTQALYRELGGTGAGAGGGTPAAPSRAPAAPRSTTAEGRPSSTNVPSILGAGTRGDPYRPTNRQDFDTLPKGAMYVNPADGQLYRKN